MSVNTPNVDGLRILSLDGGNLNCISQLKILEEFMKRLQYDSCGAKSMRPCEYFHLITGVGASGVIAIMLGVLGLPIDDTVDAFLRLCKEISLGDELDPHLRSERLVSASKTLLQRIGVSEESKLLGDLTLGGGCRVSIPYVAAADLSHCRMLRNYDSAHSSCNPTITEAIRIAWATPGLFSSIRVGPTLMQEVLISAINSVNNPTSKAVEEAHNAFGKDRRVSCLVSLGTGKPIIRSLGMGGLDPDQMVARDTEATAEQLKRRYTGLGIYFRLSVDRDLDFRGGCRDIEENAGKIISCTSGYLETHDASEILDHCIRSSQQAGHVPLENLYRTRTSGSRSSRGLPPLSAFFVPREKPMNDIIEALGTRMPGSPAIGLVIGLSGTGKTQISLKYAYDHDDEYDHIIFVDASSTESLEKGLVTRIKLIDTQLDITNVEGAMNALANPKGMLTRNWLIIMDNADNSKIKLQDYIPACEHGAILITSRNAALSDLNPDGHVEMGVMSREEAIEALLSAALGPKTEPRLDRPEESRRGRLHSSPRTQRDEECAGRIVDELGRLPLAVIQAACYIKKQKCLHQYPELLKNSRSKILRWPASVQRDTLKYAHSTYAAFDTTLSALSPRALKFLGIISFVNFSDFPKALIELAASLDFNYQPHDLLDRPPEYQSGIDFLRELFCLEGKWDPMELDGLLEELQSYSLVSLVTISTTITLRFHPLLHGWANDRLSTSDRVLFQSAAVRLLACGTNVDDDYLWPYLSSHIDRYSLTTDELHVNDKAAFIAIMRSSGQYSRTIDIWENIHAAVERVYGERHLRTSRAALKLADAYGFQGDWRRMEAMEREIVEIRRETLGNNHLETVSAIANLARTCKYYGERFDEAVEMEVEVLRVRKELCGPNNRQIVGALKDLAATYANQGKYQEAQALLVEALEIISLLVGRQHPATIDVMERLVRCHNLNGNTERAITLHQEVVDLRRAVRGDTHVKTLTAVAELYYKQGQFNAAEKIWRDLIDEGRKAVGGHHGDILLSLGGLAHSVYSLGRYVEAEALWEEVLAGRRVTLGEMHVRTLSTLSWLVHSIYCQRRYADAEELYRDLVSRDRTTYGDQHVTTLDAVACLAESITQQSRYAEAEVLWREVVAGRRVTLGDTHLGTSYALSSLANSICDQERYADAEKLFRDLVASHRITYGDQHLSTLDAVTSLAISITRQSRYAEAEALWREVLAGRRANLGEMHVDTLSTLYWLARSVYGQKRYADTEELLSDLVARDRTTYGNQHVTTLKSIDFLASSIDNQSRHAEAEVLWKEAVAGMRIKLGDEDPATLGALDDLARCIHNQGRCADAEKLCEEVLAGRRATLGEMHIDTLDTLSWLAASIYHQRRYADAEELYHDLLARNRTTYGDRHVNTLKAIDFLARSIDLQSRHAEAEVLWKEVTAGMRVELGDKDPATLDAIEDLARCIYDQGRYADAEKLFEEVLAGRRATLGEMHIDTLGVLSWLALSIHSQKRCVDAEMLYDDLVARDRTTYGDRHVNTLTAIDSLARSINMQARHAEAEVLWKEVIAGRRIELGGKDPDTLDALEDLARCIYDQGRCADAEKLWEEVLEGRRATLGEMHSDTLDTLSWLAASIYHQRRYAEAEELYRDLVGRNRTTYGDQHATALSTVIFLAQSIGQQSRYVEAEMLYREVVAARRNVLGDLHEDTLEASHWLARSIFMQKRYTEAGEILKEVVTGRQHTLGVEHEKTLDARSWLDCAIFRIPKDTEGDPAYPVVYSPPVGALADTFGT